MWQAIDDLRQSRQEHAVKHAQLDGRIDNLGEGVKAMRDAVNDSRRERTAQFEELIGRLDNLSTEIVEERGARKLRTQLTTWGIAIASALGIGSWFHFGGK